MGTFKAGDFPIQERTIIFTFLDWCMIVNFKYFCVNTIVPIAVSLLLLSSV